MSQAEELLNSLSGGNTIPYIIGDEPHIVVNSDRTITVPDELKHIAVQFDHNIETVTFDCPRYWDNHDFSKMHVYINYRRSDGYMDQYLADNLRVDESDSTIIHFEWTISKNVTQVKGGISFLVCIKVVNDDGNEEPHWNSRLNQDLVIDEGMECSKQIVESNPDIIEHLLSRMEELENSGGLTEEQTESILNDYFEKHPISEGTVKSVNNILPDENGNVVLKTDIPEHTWESLPDKPFGESEAIEITWDGNLDSIETKVVITEDIINETNYSKHYLCYVSDKVPSNEELIGNTFAYTGGNIVDQAFVEPYVDKILISDRGSTLTEDIANMGWEVYVVRKENLEYVAYDTPIVFPKAGIYFNYVVDSGSNYGHFSYASALTIPSEVNHLDEKYIPNTVARVSDINWDYLDGKPFGTMYADTVTWDGNTEGLLSVNFNGKSLYKVCDESAIEAILANGFVWNMDGVDNSVSAAEANGFYEMAGIVTDTNLNVFIIPEDNCTAGIVTFPKKGIYFYKQNETSYCNRLTISGYKIFPVGFATLDPKYLPEHEHSWNDLTDKPFDDGEVNTIEITWDGDTSGRLSFDGVPPFGATVYRVSDLVVSKDDLEGAIFIHGQDDGHLNEFIMSSDFVVEGNGYLYDEYGFIHVINDGSDESGIYFASNIGNAYGRVYSMSLTNTHVKQLDEKYIPDSIARVSDIPSIEGLATETYIDNAVAVIVDTAVTAALTEAKESGVFDGAPGADGKTPVKGTDYYTEADKTEMVNRVISALPTWTGGSY